MKNGTQNKKALQKAEPNTNKLHYKPIFWFALAALIIFLTQQIFDPLVWNSGLMGGYFTAIGCALWGLYLVSEGF